MKTLSMIFVSFCCLFAGINVRGAAGDLDPTFSAGSILFGVPYAIAIQSDGKIIIGGEFATVPGLARNNIARLNADGTGDPSFNPGSGADGLVRSIALQPDGKIVVGGWFTNFDGASHNRIVRLNADGSLDSGFNVGSGADGLIFAVAVQTDGKVLIGGYFTNVNGLSRSYIARLNADGSVDTGFNPGADYYVYAIVVQPDGKILVGGWFTTLAGVSIHGIARFNEDGSFDTSFNPGTAAYYGISALALQSDGRVLIAAGDVRRLNADGSVDASFNAHPSDEVSSIAVQSDGKILIGGQFYAINAIIHSYFARLQPDGSLDESFNPPLQLYPPGVASIVVEPQGTILVSAGFYAVNGLGPRNLVRLNPDGSVNSTLNTGRGINAGVSTGVVQADGRIVIGGGFGDVNNERRQAIARLESDGRLDKTFDAGPILNTAFYSISNPVVFSVVLQADGRILMGGAFTNINGIGRNNIARLNTDGSVDSSFNPGTGTDGSVYRVVLQHDSKVLILGAFQQVNGVPREYFTRLNEDGSLDADFNPDVDVVEDVAVQPDGKIVVVGFVFTNGPVVDYFVTRINPDGTVDPGFIRGRADNEVTSVALQSGGKIIVGGPFTTIDGVNRQGMARLNRDGTVDPGFNPDITTDRIASLIREFLLQPNGKILVSKEIGDTNLIARMNPDGSVDNSFAPCTTLGYAIPIALQPDSKLIIGGYFGIVNGVPQHAIARLLGDAPIIIITQPASRTNVVGTAATFTVNASGTPVLRYQWYRQGMPLTDSAQVSGATTTTLTLKHAQFRDAGAYTVVVSNDAGSITSEPALLRVIVPSAARK
jgi:uncharacterized delta-60 repeat protein